jgi:hypothetical protein
MQEKSVNSMGNTCVYKTLRHPKHNYAITPSCECWAALQKYDTIVKTKADRVVNRTFKTFTCLQACRDYIDWDSFLEPEERPPTTMQHTDVPESGLFIVLEVHDIFHQIIALYGDKYVMLDADDVHVPNCQYLSKVVRRKIL